VGNLRGVQRLHLKVDVRQPLPSVETALRQTSYENLTEAREFVRKVGGQQKAIAAIIALGCLKTEE
jgi:hypothetical protein